MRENPHARWPFLWGCRCRRPQATNPGAVRRRTCGLRVQAARAPIRSCSRWGLPCRACYQPRGALLPHRFTLACRQAGGRFPFLWHCPWGCPRRMLSGTVSPWSPDFPPLLSGGHPADWRAQLGTAPGGVNHRLDLREIYALHVVKLAFEGPIRGASEASPWRGA